MNTIRFFATAFALAILAGCATGPALYRADPGPQGQGGYAAVQADSGARTAPCQPFRADALMNWALELDEGKQHSRSAAATVRNGSADCTQTESAGSSSKGVQAPQPRRAEQPPAKQVEPKKEQDVTPKPQPMKGTRV